jgi:hypothetical protein
MARDGSSSASFQYRVILSLCLDSPVAGPLQKRWPALKSCSALSWSTNCPADMRHAFTGQRTLKQVARQNKPIATITANLGMQRELSDAQIERDGRRLHHHHHHHHHHHYASVIRRFFGLESTAFHVPTYHYLRLYDFKLHLTLETVSSDGPPLFNMFMLWVESLPAGMHDISRPRVTM